MSTSFQRGIFDSFNINPYSKVSKKTPINVTLRIFKKKKLSPKMGVFETYFKCYLDSIFQS